MAQGVPERVSWALSRLPATPIRAQSRHPRPGAIVVFAVSVVFVFVRLLCACVLCVRCFSCFVVHLVRSPLVLLLCSTLLRFIYFPSCSSISLRFIYFPSCSSLLLVVLSAEKVREYVRTSVPKHRAFIPFPCLVSALQNEWGGLQGVLAWLLSYPARDTLRTQGKIVSGGLCVR